MAETPTERAATLVAALRGEMPKGFKWDFQTVFRAEGCGSRGCALGLAGLLWPDQAEILRNKNAASSAAEFLGIPQKEVLRIFWNHGPEDGETYRSASPRPTTVANRLEKVLRKQHAKVE